MMMMICEFFQYYFYITVDNEFWCDEKAENNTIQLMVKLRGGSALIFWGPEPYNTGRGFLHSKTSSSMSIQSKTVTDRQTDRQTYRSISRLRAMRCAVKLSEQSIKRLGRRLNALHK